MCVGSCSRRREGDGDISVSAARSAEMFISVVIKENVVKAAWLEWFRETDVMFLKSPWCCGLVLLIRVCHVKPNDCGDYVVVSGDRPQATMWVCSETVSWCWRWIMTLLCVDINKIRLMIRLRSLQISGTISYVYVFLFGISVVKSVKKNLQHVDSDACDEDSQVI